MKKILSLAIVAIVTMVFSGCGTTQLQTRAVMTRTIVLNPVQKKDKTIFLTVKNTAGSRINLEPLLRKKLFAKGLILIDNPKVAKYIVDINVLFADNIKEAYAIKAGAAAGINTGLVAGIASDSAKNGLIAGATAALVGGLVASATEDSIYRAIIDVSIKERKGGVEGETDRYNQDYITHKTRVFVSAVKMDLKLKNAIPILENKAINQITKIF